MVAGYGDHVPHEVSSHTDDSSGGEPENKEMFSVWFKKKSHHEIMLTIIYFLCVLSRNFYR